MSTTFRWMKATVALLACLLSAPAFAQTPGICSGTVVSFPTGGGTLAGSTSGTSLRKGTCAYTRVAPEAIYEWIPSISGTATIETCGGATNFDTVVYVRKDFCTVGEQVACDNDTCENSRGKNTASRVSFSVVAGETYYIFVDGNKRSKGNFSLTVIPPGGIVTTTTTTTTSTTTTTTTSTTTTTESTTTTTTSTTTTTL